MPPASAVPPALAAACAPPVLGWRALALCLALALLAHTLVLGWLSLRWRELAVLQPMLAPMLTRQLQPSAPPAPSAPPTTLQKPATTPASTALAAIKKVAKSTPETSTTTPTVVPADPLINQTAANAQAQNEAPRTSRNTEPPPIQLTPLPPDAAANNNANSSAGNGAGSGAGSGAGDGTASAAAPTTPPASHSSASPDPLARWPVDTRLNYVLAGNYRGDLHGDAQVLWQRQAEKYQVRVSINLGLFSPLMTSQGKVSDEGLHPTGYEEKVAGIRRSITLGEQQITFNDGQQAPRPARVQDTASQFVELTWRLLSGQLALEQGAIVRYHMARPGGVDEWVYDVVALETLNTRLGGLPAWHLVPRPQAKPRGPITAEMWFAPSLQYLPVRIKMNLGGEHFVDLLIDKVEQADAR